MSNNAQLAVFSVKVETLLLAYRDRMKLFVVENAALGMPNAAIRAMRSNPNAHWAWEREKLIKEVKREAAGLINRVSMAGYTKRGL